MEKYISKFPDRQYPAVSNVNDGFPETFEFLGKGRELISYYNPEDNYIYKITTPESIKSMTDVFHYMIKVEISDSVPMNLGLKLEVLGYRIDPDGTFRLISRQEKVDSWKGDKEYQNELQKLISKGCIVHKNHLILPDNYIIRDVRKANCGLLNGEFKIFDIYFTSGYATKEEIENILKR